MKTICLALGALSLVTLFACSAPGGAGDSAVADPATSEALSAPVRPGTQPSRGASTATPAATAAAAPAVVPAATGGLDKASLYTVTGASATVGPNGNRTVVVSCMQASDILLHGNCVTEGTLSVNPPTVTSFTTSEQGGVTQFACVMHNPEWPGAALPSVHASAVCVAVVTP